MKHHSNIRLASGFVECRKFRFHRLMAASALAFLLILATAGCDPVDADFFPLVEGNTWLYDWSKRRTMATAEPLPVREASRMWRVTDPPGALAEREAATDWVAMRSTAIALLHRATDSTITFAGEYRPDGSVQVSKLNGVLTLQTQSLPDMQALDFNLPLLAWPVYRGAKWEDYGVDNLAPEPVAMCRLIGFETVETPAGTFFQCAHVVRVIDPSLNHFQLQRYRTQHFWLAPEIGLVKILYENDLGPVLRAELRAMHLNELSPAERQRQLAELDRTMDPEHSRQPDETGNGGWNRGLTPEQMYEREQWMTHDRGRHR